VDGPGLKVLYLSAGYTVHDRRFLVSLAEAGMQVSFVPLTSRATESRFLPGVIRRFAPCGRDLAVLREAEPDVVIAGPIQSSTLLVAESGFRPYVAMSWGSDMLLDAEKDADSLAATRTALAGASGAFGDCRAVRQAFHRYSSIRDDDIVTFPWGINPEDFLPVRMSSPLRSKLGWEDKTVLLTTRSWEPVYAIDVLLEAFAATSGHHDEARLLMCGDGSMEADVHRRIDEGNLGGRVHLAGRVPNENLKTFFHAADVYVSSSLSDGTSVSLLEAMACELPVVVTSSPGNREWVRAGENGWLAEPGDPKSLAVALDTALKSVSDLREMGKRNRKVIVEKADWKKNFHALPDLLSRLAETT